MSDLLRREFLARTAILGATSAALARSASAADEATPKPTASKSATDRLRVAVVGVNGRGMSHVNAYLGKNNCEITTICDCDSGVIGKAMTAVAKGQPSPAKYVQDFRKLLDDKSIDVISIATPNHWHALMAIWAMQAGKNVYCEKPATHNVKEGQLMLQAARKYDKLCQVGTQSRSTSGMRAAIDFIHGGGIGKVTTAYGTCYKRRKSIGKVDHPTAPPKTMDYNLWCGPAPEVPCDRAHLHYDWHWIWAYGNGDFGNQGVHEVDKARWGLKADRMPNSVVTVGGRFGYADDGQTPNTELSRYDYGDGREIIFEVRGLETDDFKGTKVGNIWFGDKGYVVCPSYSSGIAYDREGKKVKEFKGGGDQSHFDNFVSAVRGGGVKGLHCDIAEGHLSAALCHLANISYRVGKETPMSADIDCFAGSPQATEALGRMKEHLKKNNVDLTKAVGRVGPKLTIDPKTQQFTGGTDDLAKANALLTRDYRKGFDPNEAV